MGEEERKRRALALWEQGQREQESGALDRAIELYTQSIAEHPTAEAYTFRGWAFSFQGRIEEAIAECKKAIDVDPSFGNPYNDIGSYLIRLARFDEAHEWLEKAKTAPRYGPRHFPFMNLARLYARRGMLARAIDEIEGAIRLAPGEPTCIALRNELRGRLN
jgi:Tfp pilus assembly protein PilF